jgi:hypothetical protein
LPSVCIRPVYVLSSCSLPPHQEVYIDKSDNDNLFKNLCYGPLCVINKIYDTNAGLSNRRTSTRYKEAVSKLCETGINSRN